MTIAETAGLVGAGLAGAAYIPQISHLVRARCSGGISRLAFEAWLLASVLTTASAAAVGAAVFVALGGIQIVATALIMLCAARFKDTPCPSHARAPVGSHVPVRQGPRQASLAGTAMHGTPHSAAVRGWPLRDPGPAWPGRAKAASASNFQRHA